MSDKIKVEYIPYKHEGMKISFNGMMNQVKDELKKFEDLRDMLVGEDNDKYCVDTLIDSDNCDEVGRVFDDMSCNYSYTVSELLDHFKQLGDAFYDGDFSKVDNILQLWCLKPENVEDSK